MLGIFPDSIKYAIIKPLYKKGNKSLLANYRPISLPTAFAKLFELVVFHRFNHHVQVHNNSSADQSDFR